MYLSDVQQRWISRGCFLSALALAGVGLPLAFLNPQFTDAHQQQRVYDAGRSGQVVIDSPSNRALYTGLLMTLCGVGTAALGAMTADPNPRTLTPPLYQGLSAVVGASSGQRGAASVAPLLEWTDEATVLQQLQQQTLMLLTQNAWLKSLMKAYSVVIVGGMGSGKSSLASAIALYRKLLFGWDALIFDPHADLNLKRGTWLYGKVYGSSEFSTLPPEVQIAKYGLTALQPQSQHQSLISDEFSSWSEDPDSPLDKLATKMVGAAIRDNRKYLNHSIFLLHAQEKGMGGGENLPSGYHKALMKNSVVIILQADTDEWGDGQYAGRALYKPAFAEHKERHYTPVQLPGVMCPGQLRQDLGQLLAFCGIGLDPEPCGRKGGVDERLIDPALQAFLTQRMNPDNPEFLQTLEDLYQGTHPNADLVEGEDGVELTPSGEIDWARLGTNFDRAVGFLTYVFDTTNKVQPESDGSYKVRELLRCWGANHGFNSALFGLFLGELNQLGIGTYVQQRPKTWRPLIRAEDVPKGQ